MVARPGGVPWRASRDLLPRAVKEAVRVSVEVQQSFGSLGARVRGSLSRREWTSIAGMTAFIIALHVIGWGLLVAVIAPHHYNLGSSGVFGVGLGLTAYTLGMRHAFDADHIAAIDNTTRKLMAEGKRPVSVGFWFSLGHSSIVFGLCLLLSLGVKALAGQVQNDSSALHKTTGLIGTAVSGTFLYLIVALNLAVLVGILKVFRQMRTGSTTMAYQGRSNAAAPPARTSSPTSVAVSKPSPNNSPTGYMCQGLRTALVAPPRIRFMSPRLLSWCSRAASSYAPVRICRKTLRIPTSTARFSAAMR